MTKTEALPLSAYLGFERYEVNRLHEFQSFLTAALKSVRLLELLGYAPMYASLTTKMDVRVRVKVMFSFELG